MSEEPVMPDRSAASPSGAGERPADDPSGAVERPADDPSGAGERPTHGPSGADDPPERWPTGRLLSTAARRVERAWDAYLERWSLSHASVPVLALLAAGPRSQRELATQLHVTEQTMSRMVVRLEQTGYLRRGPDDRDRRRRVVALTPAGASVLAAVGDPAVAESLVAEHLEPGQVRALRELLIAMVSEPADRV